MRIATAVATLAVASRALGAQTGVLRGVVYDSIIGAPLAGAEVWLQDNPRTAVTARDGSFRIDSLPAGTYTVTFGHASLDSLGLGAPFGRVDVRARDTAHVRLTTPSIVGIAHRLCPSTSLDSAGAILGVVRDAAADAPMRGARVEVEWMEWTLQNKNVRREARTLSATTDATGRYVACGVPNDVVVELHAAADSARGTGRVLLDVRGRVLTWRNLALGAATTASVDGASLVLAVVDSAGRPVAGAQARVGSASEFSTASDDGRLRLTGLPAGSRGVEVRAIGYLTASASVELRAGASVERTIPLRRNGIPMLETVRIVGANRYRDVTGFEERRARGGVGYFIDANDIDRHPPSRFTDLMRRVPGMQVILPAGGGPPILRAARASRGFFGQNGKPSVCPLSVFVDGISIGADNIDAALLTTYIRGIEVYPGSAGVPPKYGTSPCGTILVWTK